MVTGQQPHFLVGLIIVLLLLEGDLQDYQQVWCINEPQMVIAGLYFRIQQTSNREFQDWYRNGMNIWNVYYGGMSYMYFLLASW